MTCISYLRIDSLIARARLKYIRATQKEEIKSRVTDSRSVTTIIYSIIAIHLATYTHTHTHARTHAHARTHTHTHTHTYIYIYIYIYIHLYIYVKESKRTHRFSVTLSFAPKRSSDRLTIYSSIYVSVCLSICVSVCLFVCQSIYLSILSNYRFIPSLSTFLSINISIRQSFCSLSICRYVNLSVYLLIYPSVFVYLYNVTVE